MWKFAVVCTALLAFSVPALAQNAPPPTDQTDPGTPGFSPATLVLVAAGVGLSIWAISAATKKSSPASP